MNWVKRNLFWVVGGVISLGLLGGAFYYLYSSLQAEKQIDEELNAKVALKEKLENDNPHPGRGDVDNVAEAKKDEQRVLAFHEQVKKHFAPIATPAVSDTREFKLLLDNTQAELENEANTAGVLLPAAYSFTFDVPKKSATLEPASLKPLAQQLAEVKALCEILFKAKVHSIESMRRVSVSRTDTGNNDYIPRTPSSNALAVMMPYEIIFKTFSSELGEVINGLSHSPHAFIIRTFNTEVTTATAPGSGDAESPYGYPGGMHDPSMSRYGALMRGGAPGGEMSEAQAAQMSRYQMMRRYGRAYGGADPTQPAIVAPPPRSGPTNVITEKPLRVSMLVDAVRLKADEAPAKPAAPGRSKPSK
jgi:hypothetical protein